MIKVITYGTFDLLHEGHIRLLRRAKALHGGAPVETPCARPVPRVQQSVACVAAAAMEGGRSCPS